MGEDGRPLKVNKAKIFTDGNIGSCGGGKYSLHIFAKDMQRIQMKAQTR